jgi:phospholipase/carboxylesterase
MNAASDLPLRQDASLSYRALGSATPSRLLLLLHGVGGNETNLAPLAQLLANDDTLVVLARAPLQLAPGQHAWFPVRFGAAGPQPDLDQAERSNLALQAFILRLQARHRIAPARTVVAGFSQGGIMSASVALVAPDRVAGFGVFCGRILPEIEPQIARAPALRELDALIAHGTQDTKLPASWAERADALLTRLDVPHRTVFYPVGHEMSAPMQQDILAWWRRPQARWNRTG